MFMTGAAVGSALAGLAYTHGGWPSVALTGAAFPMVAFFYWLAEA